MEKRVLGAERSGIPRNLVGIRPVLGEDSVRVVTMSNNTQVEQRRSHALDALRGFAILTMVLSGLQPHGVLPNWMYHAQTPPPTHQFDGTIPGITWVDLVFPFFLFAMGAAIPLALSRRIEKGTASWRIAGQILARGMLLGGFALYIAHIRPYAINPNPTTATWTLAILGFTLLFPVLVRLPGAWSPWLRCGIKIIGWGGAVAFMALMRYPDGGGFSLGRSDIIIKLLTTSAVYGSFIWMVSRTNIPLRLGFLGIVMAMRLSQHAEGWVQWIYANQPIPWLIGHVDHQLLQIPLQILANALNLGYAQYLFIVIPGTVVGDMILRWMKSPENDGSDWSPARFLSAAGLMLALIVVILVGLQARWLGQTVLMTGAMLAFGWWLLRNPRNSTEALLNNLFKCGALLLAIGLVFEPYEGGIKKDSATMSYYLVTSGLAVFMLTAFTIVINVFRKKRWLSLLIDNGQNPMIAYVGSANFILPVLTITGLSARLHSITPTPWLGFGRGVFLTMLLALMVTFFTRKKIFWRT